MAKTIKDIVKDLTLLTSSIDQLLASADYETYDDLSGIDVNYDDADELYLLNEARAMIDKLADISRTIKYLKQPIISEGLLHRKSNGRYELNGQELSCGQEIEYLTSDAFYDSPYWCYGVIEHNGTDYYIVGANVELEGLRVRIRKK